MPRDKNPKRSPEEHGNRKVRWSQPRLSRFGTVQGLTMGSGNGMADGMGNLGMGMGMGMGNMGMGNMGMNN